MSGGSTVSYEFLMDQIPFPSHSACHQRITGPVLGKNGVTESPALLFLFFLMVLETIQISLGKVIAVIDLLLEDIPDPAPFGPSDRLGIVEGIDTEILAESDDVNPFPPLGNIVVIGVQDFGLRHVITGLIEPFEDVLHGLSFVIGTETFHILQQEGFRLGFFNEIGKIIEKFTSFIIETFPLAGHGKSLTRETG